MSTTFGYFRDRGPSAPPTFTMPELDRDPHSLFRRMRLMTPFLQCDNGSYIAIRSGDVERLYGDTRTRQMETEGLRSLGIHHGYLHDIVQHTMLYANGTAHRQRRAPLSRAFAFRLITELRPAIRTRAHSLLDQVEGRSEMDFVDEYAALIPAHIIGEVLGLHEGDIPQFTRWVYSISRAISFSFPRAEIPQMEDAARNLTEYVQNLLADRRTTPRMDFLSSYVLGVDATEKLSPIEVISQIITVIIAGSDTTRAAMAILVSLLLQHREQWEAVCNGDMGLIASAVSESMRYEPAVGSTPRFTMADIELAGYLVPAGSVLSLSTLSAMRDPALYTDPDRFNIRRTDHPRRHIVFGGGAHRCLGEALARAELEEALAALAERLPNLHLLNEPLRIFGHAGVRRVSGMRVGWARP
jgi:cytochrome P450 family 103